MSHLHNYAKWANYDLKNPNIRTKSKFLAALKKLGDVTHMRNSTYTIEGCTGFLTPDLSVVRATSQIAGK